HLLLVTARKVACDSADALCTDVELLELLLRERRERLQLDRAVLDERLALGAIEHEVLRDRKRLHEPVYRAILGNKTDTLIEDLPHALLDEGDAIEGDLPSSVRLEAHDGFDEFRLAIALNAGDADDFAGFDIERDVVDDDVALGVDDGEVIDDERRLTRVCRTLLDHELDG